MKLDGPFGEAQVDGLVSPLSFRHQDDIVLFRWNVGDLETGRRDLLSADERAPVKNPFSGNRILLRIHELEKIDGFAAGIEGGGGFDPLFNPLAGWTCQALARLRIPEDGAGHEPAPRLPDFPVGQLPPPVSQSRLIGRLGGFVET